MKKFNHKQIFSRITSTALLCLIIQLAQVRPLASMELFANLEHSDYLPPANSFQPGQGIMDRRRTQNPPIEDGEDGENTRMPRQKSMLEPRIEWFMIPNWLAGQWSKKGDLTTSVTKLSTGRRQQTSIWTDDEMIVSWGHQVDRTGTVWHANFLPSERTASSDNKAVKFLTTSMICERVDAQSLVTRSHYIVTETKQGQVISSFQQESLNMYNILNDGELNNPSSNRVFSDRGQAVEDGTLSTRYTRVNNFQPQAMYNGVNLVESLKEYLENNGMAQRVPVN